MIECETKWKLATRGIMQLLCLNLIRPRPDDILPFATWAGFSPGIAETRRAMTITPSRRDLDKNEYSNTQNDPSPDTYVEKKQYCCKNCNTASEYQIRPGRFESSWVRCGLIGLVSSATMLTPHTCYLPRLVSLVAQ